MKYEAVMELLMEMDKLRKMKGITHAQKGRILLLLQIFWYIYSEDPWISEVLQFSQWFRFYNPISNFL